jgi:hypothetical protein
MSGFVLVKRTLIAFAGLAGFVLFVSLGARVYGAVKLDKASARFEREVGPLNLLTFVRPELPPEENAVTWLRPGVLAIVLFPQDRAVLGKVSGKATAEWTVEERDALGRILERNELALGILARARSLRQSNWDVSYEKGNDAKLPDLLAAVNAGKLVAARGRLALERGDREAALESVEILGTLARSHQREQVTIMLLIGVALERLQLGLVQAIVSSPTVDAGELSRLQATLCDLDLTDALQNGLRGEAAAMLHSIQEDALQNEIPRIVPKALAVGVTQLLMAAALDARRTVDPALFGPVRSPLPGPKSYDDQGWWEKLTSIYGPNVASAAARGTATRSARELARLAIVLRRDALVRGSYPTTFVTPTDPLTGEPFVFNGSRSGAELRSATTPEIVQSIFPVSGPLNAQLYSWTLPPASSRPTTPPPSPAGRRAASS